MQACSRLLVPDGHCYHGDRLPCCGHSDPILLRPKPLHPGRENLRPLELGACQTGVEAGEDRLGLVGCWRVELQASHEREHGASGEYSEGLQARNVAKARTQQGSRGIFLPKRVQTCIDIHQARNGLSQIARSRISSETLQALKYVLNET